MASFAARVETPDETAARLFGGPAPVAAPAARASAAVVETPDETAARLFGGAAPAKSAAPVATPAAVETPDETAARLFGGAPPPKGAAPAAPAAPAASSERSALDTGITALKRGARGAVANLKGVYDPVGAAADQEQIAKELPRTNVAPTDATSIGEFAAAVGESAVEALPAFGATLAASAAVVASGGSALAAAGAGAAVAAPQSFGGIKTAQQAETGKTNNLNAAAGAAASTALELIAPLRLARAGVGPVVEMVKKSVMASAAKKGAEGVVAESATEFAQNIIETIAAVPDKARILFTPANDAERAQALAMVKRATDDALAGGALGGSAGGIAGGVGQRRTNKAVDRANAPPAAPAAPVNPADPYSFSMDNRASVDDYMKRIGFLESRNDPNAQNPLSSASGQFQFTDSTWLSYMRREEPDLTRGKSNAAIVGMKANPRLQDKMMRAFTADNAKALERAGLPVANGTLGVMHRFGVSGGIKVLKAAQRDPGTPIASLLSQAGLDQNPDLKTAKLDTAGEVVSWYEQRLGLGLTFNRNGGSNVRVGGRDVQTRDDRTGNQFTTFSLLESANAASDLFAASLEQQLNAAADAEFSTAKAKARRDGTPAPTAPDPASRDRIPEATRQRLALALEAVPDNPDAAALPASGKRVLARIMELADGISTLNLDTVQASQVQQAAANVLDQLGYSRNERAPGDVSSINNPSDFRAPAPGPAGTDPAAPRWQLANSLRLAFSLLNNDPNLGRITPESGGNVIAQTLRTLAAQQDKLAMTASTTASNKTGAARRVANKGAQAAARLRTAFERGAAATEYLAETPSNQKGNKNFQNPAEARTAILDMFAAASKVPAARSLARVLTQFTPMMTSERSTARGKGYFTFFKQLEAVAESAGATDKATRDAIRIMFKTSDQRAQALKGQLTAQGKQRNLIREAERAARNEQRARDAEAWAKSIANVQDSQVLNRVNRLSDSIPMLLDVLEGKVEKAEAYAPTQREPNWIYNIFKSVGLLQRGLDVMPLVAVDKEVVRRNFTDFTLSGRRLPFVRHILRVGTAAQGYTRAHIADAERVTTILTDSVQGTANPQEEMRLLTSIMLDATHERLAAAAETPKRGYVSLKGFFDAMASGAYTTSTQELDPNGRHAREDADGRWSYAEDVDEKIRQLSADLDARPLEQREAYVQTRGLLKDSMLTLLLAVINNRRRELGLPVVQKTTDADKILAGAAETYEGDPTLTQESRDTLNALLRGSLEGDYFPLQRSGPFSLFARQNIVLRGAGKAALEARATEMQKSSPFIQFENRGRQAVAVVDPENPSAYVVRLERVFYSHFDTRKEADAARAALLDPTTPADQTPDEVLTQRKLEPNFIPDEIGQVIETDTGVDKNRATALTDAQAAALMGAAKDDVELKNLLIELLPDRRMAASLRSRKDVLGAPALMPEILRTREPLVAAALGRVSTAQDMREVFGKAREHQKRTVGQATNAATPAEGKRLAARADRQAMLIDYLEKRTTEKIDPIFNNNINDVMARSLTVWFLAGTSNAMMNLLQVSQFGVPEFDVQYGPFAGARLMKTYMRSLLHAGNAFRRARVRGGLVEGSTRDALDYFVDGREVDARHFYTKNPETGELRINTPAEMAALNWNDVAGRPKGASFEVDNFGAPKVFLVSESEFETYQKGKYSSAQIVALSNARKGGHLSAVFTEEARITRLRAMSKSEKAGEQLSSLSNKVFDVATFAPTIIEYANRHAVVLATLSEEMRVYRARGVTGEIPLELFAEVERKASTMNDNINANYQTLNRSVLQRKLGFLGQFSTLPTSIMMHLWHITAAIVSPTTTEGGYSRKQAAALTAGLFVTLGIAAGGRGAMPVFIDLLARAGLNVLSWMLDDDDDDIFDKTSKYGARTAIEMSIREQSRLLADLWTKGPLSMLTGADLQGRLGVDQFPIRIDTGLTLDKDSLGSVLVSFLGPVGTPLGAALEVIGNVKAGTPVTARNFESLLPKFIRDAGRAFEYVAGKGHVDNSGNVIQSVEQTQADYAWISQLLGFTPNSIADVNKARLVQIERDIKLRARRKAIMDDFTDLDGDMDFDALVDFNTENPERAITAAGIVSALKGQQEGDAMREGLTSGLSPQNPLEAMQLAEDMGLTEADPIAAVDLGDVEGDVLAPPLAYEEP